MVFTTRDHARLAKILEVAHQLERSWPLVERSESVLMTQNPLYSVLREGMVSCLEAESAELKRLADRAKHLHDKISLAHFYACIVPFERVAGRGLRDDEFLIDEGDSTSAAGIRLPLKLVVENLRSAFNVGALFRTAECLGVSEILLCGYTPSPQDSKTSRTSMGTGGLVPWRQFDRAAQACAELKEDGYKVVALETAASAVSLEKIEFERAPLAFVVGNERFGLDRETLAEVDSICRIPVRGAKNSLNVGIAFGIAAFEWVRQFESEKR